MLKSLTAPLIVGSCLLLSACSDSDNPIINPAEDTDTPVPVAPDTENVTTPESEPDAVPATPATDPEPVADPTTEPNEADTPDGTPPDVLQPPSAPGAVPDNPDTPVTETPEPPTVEQPSEPEPAAPADPVVTPAPPAVPDNEPVAGPTVPDNTPIGPDSAPGVPDTPAPAAPSDLAPAIATGADTTGSADDSPTSTESLSVRGPFLRDPNRGAGPPSVPQGLTLLLQSNDWLKFSWAPSTDDQSVEAYEVYRDGQLISTIRGDTGYEHDYRRWLSTSIIDCNYTRYANCSTENLQPIPGNSYAYSVAAVDNEGMRSARSAEVVYTFPARSQSGVDLTGYEPVFDEEFDGTSLNRNLWKTSLPWGPDRIINGELQYFANVFGPDPIDYNPFVFTGDTLKITGIATPPNLLAQANNQPYLSGVISTLDYFKMTYGYVEMNARLASGQGLLSTFYLFNQDYYKNKPEIDIVEYISHRPDKAYQTYHYYDSNRARFNSGEKHSSPTMEAVAGGVNLSDDYHRYAVLWEPGLIIWYIDDVEIQRISGVRVSDEPMNIVAQLVVGSNWIGPPDAQSIPAVLEIDYIKAWQKQP
jgi:hypothetical protein